MMKWYENHSYGFRIGHPCHHYDFHQYWSCTVYVVAMVFVLVMHGMLSNGENTMMSIVTVSHHRNGDGKTSNINYTHIEQSDCKM